MFFRTIILLFVLLGLTSCKGFLQTSIDKTGSKSAELPAFESFLDSGYLELAQSELSEDDFRDARVFLDRVYALRENKDLDPTEVDERNFTPENAAVVSQARRDLMELLDGGARINRPEIAARAQIMFDCWAQELEENRQPNHIKLCRENFVAAVSGLKGIAYSVGAGGDFAEVFFGFDVYNKAVSGANEMIQLSNAAKSNNVAFVLVTANSDSSGSLKYNYQLSKKRGEYVRDLLIDNGIDASLISVVPLGENNLPINTGDGVKEPGNRRVKVEFRY